MTNDKIQMTNVNSNDQISKKKFDLEERTSAFSKKCIDVMRSIPKDIINSSLIEQLMRSSSSVGANYREANEAQSKKEFFHRIGIARKESKESHYWLELLIHACPSHSDRLNPLLDEASQLSRIFASIVRTRIET